MKLSFWELLSLNNSIIDFHIKQSLRLAPPPERHTQLLSFMCRLKLSLIIGIKLIYMTISFHLHGEEGLAMMINHKEVEI